MASKSVRIAPSILSADFARLGEQLVELENLGVDRVHVDVMDGHFVPPITMGPVIVDAVRAACDLPIEVHLMVDRPEDQVDPFVDAGAQVVIVQQEATPHLHRLMERIHDRGARAGVAINPATPAHTLDAILDDIDLGLAMTVNPGYAGQAFIPSVLRKVEQLSTLLHERNPACEIEVDGGVNAETASDAVRAGATVLVAASAIFKHPDGLKGGVDALRTATQSPS